MQCCQEKNEQQWRELLFIARCSCRIQNNLLCNCIESSRLPRKSKDFVIDYCTVRVQSLESEKEEDNAADQGAVSNAEVDFDADINFAVGDAFAHSDSDSSRKEDGCESDTDTEMLASPDIPLTFRSSWSRLSRTLKGYRAPYISTLHRHWYPK